ncbi:hypothetical protein NSU08_20590 [Paenibacillus sp. FSL H7-0331]|uniref:hypothetical protein n=1 Tax=Paenibacillus sp. FSL H7-0331 TaxID=1920421 RepID=UPI0030FC9E08
MPLGGYHWRILDIQGNTALILTEHMIEQHSYITDNEKKYGERQYEVDFIRNPPMLTTW